MHFIIVYIVINKVHHITNLLPMFHFKKIVSIQHSCSTQQVGQGNGKGYMRSEVQYLALSSSTFRYTAHDDSVEQDGASPSDFK